jgi:hypothetical protein
MGRTNFFPSSERNSFSVCRHCRGLSVRNVVFDILPLGENVKIPTITVEFWQGNTELALKKIGQFGVVPTVIITVKKSK